MAPNPPQRTTLRASRAQSITSETSFAATPRALPAVTRRRGTRAIRADSIVSDARETTPAPVRIVELPACCTLPPTVPSPFTGTLDASLDAILVWGSQYVHTNSVVHVLLRDVDATTNWPALLKAMWLAGNTPVGRGRYLVESLLFLVTRKLLPEQVAGSRAAMTRLYERKKQLAIRVVLRYDMLREWKFDAAHHVLSVPSMAPVSPAAAPPRPVVNPMAPSRPPFMPNLIATLIAGPVGGFATHGMRERMKHHITELDDWLLLSDEKVGGWSDVTLVAMTSQIVLQWQWLRQNNEMLEDMEVNDWEEMGGRADECQWIADDVKKPSWFKNNHKGGSGITDAEVKVKVEMEEKGK